MKKGGTIAFYIEQFYPLALAIVGMIVFYYIMDRIHGLDLFLIKLSEAAIAVSAPLLGFFLTITTIIHTITTRRMQFVKDVGQYHGVLVYLRTSIGLNIIVITIAITFPFFYNMTLPERLRTSLYLGEIFFILWAWIASVRVSQVFLLLVHDPETNKAEDLDEKEE